MISTIAPCKIAKMKGAGVVGGYAIGSLLTLVTFIAQIELAKAFGVGFGPSLVIYVPAIMAAILWGRRVPRWRKPAFVSAMGNGIILLAGLGLIGGFGK